MVRARGEATGAPTALGNYLPGDWFGRELQCVMDYEFFFEFVTICNY